MNQGPLDSCWAVAAVGAIEGLHKIRTGKLERLSSQQVYDCANKDNVHNINKAFDRVLRNGGVASEREYPYTGQVQACKPEKLKKISASIRGYVGSVNSERDLMLAVARQPVAVQMKLDEATFAAYRGGIFTGPCGEIGHAMLAVGYGATADGTKYWIIKNSYGVHWGDHGYFYVRRGPDSGVGLCGMAWGAGHPN